MDRSPSRKSKHMVTEIKIAYYRKQDWQKLLLSSADRKTMHDSWEEWKIDYDKTIKRLEILGIDIHEITVDIDALNKYCRNNKLENVGSTRSEYVSQVPLPEENN